MGISSHLISSTTIIRKSKTNLFLDYNTRNLFNMACSCGPGGEKCPCNGPKSCTCSQNCQCKDCGKRKACSRRSSYFENICRTVELQTWGNLIAFAMKQRRRAGEGEKKSGVISQRISPKQLSTLISTNDTGRKDPEISTKLYVKADF